MKMVFLPKQGIIQALLQTLNENSKIEKIITILYSVCVTGHQSVRYVIIMRW